MTHFTKITFNRRTTGNVERTKLVLTDKGQMLIKISLIKGLHASNIRVMLMWE